MKKILDKIFKRPEVDLIKIWKHTFLMRLLIGLGIISSMTWFFVFNDIQGFIIALMLGCSYEFMDYVVLSISRQVSKKYKLTLKPKKQCQDHSTYDEGC